MLYPGCQTGVRLFQTTPCDMANPLEGKSQAHPHVYSHPQEHVSQIRPVIYVGIRHVCIIPVARIRLLINKVIVGIVTKRT